MIDLKASRPTRFMSSPWPAMPTTSVAKISGAMIDLIIRRKICENGRNDWDRSGRKYPISVPITIEIRIHFVRLMPRSLLQSVGAMAVVMGL